MGIGRGDEEAVREVIVVPHDPVVEQVVLAAAMVDREARTRLARVIPDASYFPTAQFAHAWAGMLELERRRLDYDPVLLKKLVPDADVDHLAAIAAARPDAPNDLDEFVRILHWDANRARAASGPVSDLLAALRDPTHPPERVRALARAVGASFDGGVGAGRYIQDSNEVARSQAAEIRKRLTTGSIHPYGLAGLDVYEVGAEDGGVTCGGEPRTLPGSSPGFLTLITGWTSEGKSSFAANIALGLARQRRKGLYCAWEPKSGVTLETMACISLGYSRSRLLQGKLSPRPYSVEELATHERRMVEIGKYVQFMSNPFREAAPDPKGRRKTNDYNLALVQEHIATSGAEWVIFDLWERCLEDDDPKVLSRALWKTQGMAEALNFHGIILAQQLIKSQNVRADRRPTLANVHGSAAYTHVVDTAMGVYRPGRWKPGVADDTMEVEFLKGRAMRVAPTAVEMRWNGDTGALSGGRTIRPTAESIAAGGDDAFDGMFQSPKGGGRSFPPRRRRE